MQTLNEFLGQYYELFAELEINKAQLSEEFYDVTRKLLLNQFEQASSTFLDEQELQFADKRFKLRFDVANYTPRRRFIFWWNRKAKALLKQYRAELEKYLASLDFGTDNQTNNTLQEPLRSDISLPIKRETSSPVEQNTEDKAS